MYPNRIETERLCLEPVHEQMNPKELYRYCGEENGNIDDLTRHISWDKHPSVLKSVKVLSNMRNDWFEGEAAHYQISYKNDDEFIGLGSLDIDHSRNRAEIGVWLRKKFWGNKISKERALALSEVGFNLLDLSSIIVIVSEKNEKSQKAVSKYMSKLGGEKCGKIPDGHLFESGDVTDSVIYSVTSEQFESNFSDNDSVIESIEWN